MASGRPSASPLDASVELGSYRILWHQETALADQVASLEIFDIMNRESATLIWSSPPSMPFIQAAQGKVEIRERSGSFQVERQRPLWRCESQTIESLTPTSATSARLRGTLHGEKCVVSYDMTFRILETGQLAFQISFPQATEAPNRVYLLTEQRVGQRFFGLGEQYTFLNLAGNSFEVLVEEQGHGRGLQPWSRLGERVAKGISGSPTSTYAPVPYYFSDELRGMFLRNPEISTFDFTQPNFHKIEVLASTMDGVFIHGPTPAALVESLTSLTGRPPLAPDWIDSGAIVGATGGMARVDTLLEKLRSAGAKIAALLIQDWCGERATSVAKRVWWHWQLDSIRYPNWQETIAKWQSWGTRTLGYINPFLTPPPPKYQGRNLYTEAEQKGYLIRNAKGQIDLIKQGGFDAALIDLSNPAAVQWLQEIMQKEMLGNGMSGWMADFGEALSFDAKLSSNQAPAQVHNQYPILWSKLNRDLLSKPELGGQGFFFNRSGFPGSSAATSMYWAGDQLTSWDRFDGMKTLVVALLSSGLSGMPINHGDTGGYTTLTFPGRKPVRRDKEMLERWIELSTFTPLLRTHEGNRPEISHQIDSDPETLAFFARFSRIFAFLQPYRAQLRQQATRQGWPMIRPLFFHFPQDPESWNQDQQFMLGEDFLVAPVMDPGANSSLVYLPPGSWVHLWSGKIMESTGNQVTVDSPIGSPAVFFRRNSEIGGKLATWIASEHRSHS